MTNKLETSPTLRQRSHRDVMVGLKRTFRAVMFNGSDHYLSSDYRGAPRVAIRRVECLDPRSAQHRVHKYALAESKAPTDLGPLSPEGRLHGFCSWELVE
jgi:hypothetical protein